MGFDNIVDTIDRALESAGLKRDTPATSGVRATIDRALAAAGLTAKVSSPTERPPAPAPSRARPAEYTDVGQFISLCHSSRHGNLRYKLYLPSGYDGSPMPLIVMLHGCKQSPDDFAAGTRMNRLAEHHGFLVAYPAQEQRANGSNCWNWFESAQQTRAGVEPSLIAGMVGEIAGSHAVKQGQVYVAGLSAGAAMAVILGRAYPEIFTAVAAHSGLPVGAAHDLPSAFAAMQGRAAAARPARNEAPCVRTIVFHGDSDATVTQANGASIVRQSVAAFEQDGRALKRVVRSEAAAGGRRCTTTEFRDPAGQAMVEEWVVHGGSHAWFGGSGQGSYTDPTGPDASAQIVRFFLAREARG
ncbi:PHB depolymerase family esterase [Aquincola sp. S2]|uniref:PHB depolymerase family esterase n=1 Tax=Pseudaquabacterium terrae TaxID=2732868 RepID=A0ABX2EP72_9BURK|nr:PHB depolymerase family esterase [Aquabacterium terrae]NRF70445.1 PHB depolymerase family esterase [Aquabacterium terrae]